MAITIPPVIPAPSGAGWLALDMSSWTITDGSVAGLVTAVDADTITVADLAADTYAKLTRLVSTIEVAAGKQLDVYLNRPDAGGNDRIGFAVGIGDGGSVNAACGLSNSNTSTERMTITNASAGITSMASVHQVRFSISRAVADGNLLGWAAFFLAADGNYRLLDRGVCNATPAGPMYLTCWVRHGATTGLGPQDIDYAGVYRISDLVSPT